MGTQMRSMAIACVCVCVFAGCIDSASDTNVADPHLAISVGTEAFFISRLTTEPPSASSCVHMSTAVVAMVNGRPAYLTFPGDFRDGGGGDAPTCEDATFSYSVGVGEPFYVPLSIVLSDSSATKEADIELTPNRMDGYSHCDFALCD
jgi:hypothetical protein